MPFDKLAVALRSPTRSELNRFINQDSDGLGHPLPREVCRHFGLAVRYAEGAISNYSRDILAQQTNGRRLRRAETQRRRRAAQRHGLEVDVRHREKHHISHFKISNIHLVAGALATFHWTGSKHYSEQTEILEIMGLAKSQDLIRDRVEYLRTCNYAIYNTAETQAIAIKQTRRAA